MLQDRRIKIAWRTYLAELGVVQALERPCEAEIAERFRRYFRWRFQEAVRQLPGDSSLLTDVLNEMFALLIGEDEVEGWRPPALAETLSRITEPIIASSAWREDAA
jgi:hypothetical protein